MNNKTIPKVAFQHHMCKVIMTSITRRIRLGAVIYRLHCTIACTGSHYATCVEIRDNNNKINTSYRRFFHINTHKQHNPGQIISLVAIMIQQPENHNQLLQFNYKLVSSFCSFFFEILNKMAIPNFSMHNQITLPNVLSEALKKFTMCSQVGLKPVLSQPKNVQMSCATKCYRQIKTQIQLS